MLAALDDPDLQASHVTYWDNVYGFKMTCMKSEVIKEASVEIVKAEKIISDQVVVKVQLYLLQFGVLSSCDIILSFRGQSILK